MKILVAQIKHNPYRDLDKFPINRAKVDALKESIQQTDFWDNLLARPENNDPEADLTLIAGYNEEAPIFLVELAYGHHRLVAVQELGIKEIDIPVKHIDDKTMLKIMANENKGDWAGDMSVILETVRQARKFLVDNVAQYADYKAYSQAGETFFSKEAFAQIPKQGVGFKSVQKFLGETWSDQDVRKAVSVLKDIDEGLYEQEQIISFPSVGVLGGFSKLAGAIYNQNWPAFFKAEMVNEIASMISDPKVSTTVKILTSATQAANDGKDPVRVIKNPGQKRKDFSIAKAIKDRVYENMDPNTLLKLDEIPEIEGFKGFEGLDAILEEVKKSINRSSAAKKAAETGEVAITEDGEEITPEMAADTSALEDMISAAEAEIGTPEEATPALGDVPSDDELVSDDTPLTCNTVRTMVAQLSTFVDGLPVDTELEDELQESLHDLTDIVMTAYFITHGLDNFKILAREVIENLS